MNLGEFCLLKSIAHTYTGLSLPLCEMTYQPPSLSPSLPPSPLVLVMNEYLGGLAANLPPALLAGQGLTGRGGDLPKPQPIDRSKLSPEVRARKRKGGKKGNVFLLYKCRIRLAILSKKKKIEDCFLCIYPITRKKMYTCTFSSYHINTYKYMVR